MAALEMRKRADARAGFDRDAGAEDDMRLDHRVAPDHGVGGKTTLSGQVSVTPFSMARVRASA
jgi:hypothetical protein